MLGFKSEKSATVFDARNGCHLEVLGGIFNQYSQESSDVWPGTTAIVGRGSTLSIVAATNGPDRANEGFETLVQDTQRGQTRRIRWDSPLFPSREGRRHQSIIPLYISE